MSDTEYDVVVIGAGPVGENIADRIVQGGLTVAGDRSRTRRGRMLLLGVHAHESTPSR
jgi:pyruvate/2-oxoglutarate dehydrogenase complex dihydrolipoamide dehydrogenase (E3) component